MAKDDGHGPKPRSHAYVGMLIGVLALVIESSEYDWARAPSDPKAAETAAKGLPPSTPIADPAALPAGGGMADPPARRPVAAAPVSPAPAAAEAPKAAAAA